MRIEYISDDNQVFKTEAECRLYEFVTDEFRDTMKQEDRLKLAKSLVDKESQIKIAFDWSNK